MVDSGFGGGRDVLVLVEFGSWEEVTACKAYPSTFLASLLSERYLRSLKRLI